jgi:hypothetical protein
VRSVISQPSACLLLPFTIQASPTFRFWGTPEQQRFVELCRDQHPGANWDMPVCESHAEGTAFN